MSRTFSRAKKPKGFLMLLALVFGAIFVTILGALSSYVLVENRLGVTMTEIIKAA